MQEIKLAIFAVGLSLASASAFAAKSCEDYMAGVNNAMLKRLNTSVPNTYKDLSFDKLGNIVYPERGEKSVAQFKSFTLPPAVGKKVYYRFTDVATKGTRTATGRLICVFKGEWSDGYMIGKDVWKFDVDPFNNTSDVSMFYAPDEDYSGVQFNVNRFTQNTVNSAIAKTVFNDPEFKAQLAKSR
ncbi:hypothetical protein ACFDR9_003074 [Janthinobacterium sp. CG_23.3]|uniref:hypothetical protein n=1 Tax=Janthinobacterium sp. CG_23.3 TaxID=3349634 RepID=UPI0038D4C978